MGGSTRPHLDGLSGAVAVHVRVEARAAELAHPVAQVEVAARDLVHPPPRAGQMMLATSKDVM